jgi:hypothetical protein
MKKVWLYAVLACSLIFSLTGLCLFPTTVMAFDVGKAVLGAEEGSVVLDGYATAGRQFEAEFTTADGIETFTASSKENQWYAEGEIGVKCFDLVRPFTKLETLTGVYAERTYGMDIYWPLAGLDAGIRGAYISNEQYGLSKNKFGYAGLILKF